MPDPPPDITQSVTPQPKILTLLSLDLFNGKAPLFLAKTAPSKTIFLANSTPLAVLTSLLELLEIGGQKKLFICDSKILHKTFPITAEAITTSIPAKLRTYLTLLFINLNPFDKFIY